MAKGSGKYKIIAVIYIGSNALYLKIGEIKDKKHKIIDALEYPLAIGKDTFTKGKIGFEKVEKTCEVLTGFLRIIDEYKIKTVKTIATTSLREAKNRDYVLDQIRVKTGLDVDILDDSEEKVFTYKEVSRKLKNYLNFEKEEALITSIGSGSVGVSVYSFGNINFTQNLRVGSLKISEIFGNIQEETDKFYIVVEEYLKGFTYTLKNMLQPKNLQHFIAAGSEIETIADMCHSERDENFIYIQKKDFDEMYEKIKDKTPEQLMSIYDISEEKAEVLLPSMAIFRAMLRITKADKIISPSAFIVDYIIYEKLYPEEAVSWDKIFIKNTVLSAKTVARKYFYNEEHAKAVENYAVTMFDKLQKIHGLSSRERLILQVAAIMHDIGKYINVKSHYDHSYNIIKASDILGLTNVELDLVANVARYHSSAVPTLEHRGYKELEPKYRVLISKLTSILRLADALERSHTQKYKDIDVRIKRDKMEIIVDTDREILLEEWTFNKKSDFFEEVYGIKAVIKRKKNI